MDGQFVARKAASARPPLRTLFAYATGEGAISLALGGIANFAMLYYTQVLGLSAKLAGLVLSIALVWNGLVDPIMGHLTDNMRSRFGRYHPYMLLGGVALGISFYFAWAVPQVFTHHTLLFWYLLVIHLMLRTAATMFSVPHGALGFKICANYEERSRLQGVRGFFREAINFLGGGLAWMLFFRIELVPMASASTARISSITTHT